MALLRLNFEDRLMTIPYHTIKYRTLAYLRLNSEGGYFMAISDWAEELAVLAPVRGIAADTELGGVSRIFCKYK